LEFDQKRFVVEQHDRLGRPQPPVIQDLLDREPDLEEFEDFYLVAFWRLVTERRGGHVIPYSEIRKYAECNFLDPSMTEVLVRIIWFLERSYSDWQKQEQERSKIANKPSPAKRARKK